MEPFPEAEISSSVSCGDAALAGGDAGVLVGDAAGQPGVLAVGLGGLSDLVTRPLAYLWIVV